jgi:hypothetical protein
MRLVLRMTSYERGSNVTLRSEGDAGVIAVLTLG